MTHDNDLIRRGAILELCQTLEDEAPSGSYDNGGTTDGWMMACRRVEKAIAALPAVAASQPANPVINADSRQRVTAYLARRKKSAQTVYEEVHSYDVGCDGEVVLLASDIEALIDPRDAQIERLVGAAEKVASWDHCWPGNINLEREIGKMRAALAAVKGGAA